MDESVEDFNKKDRRELKKELKEEDRKKEERSKTGRNLLTLLGIVGIIGAIGYGLMKLSDPNTSFAPKLSQEIEEIDHVKGSDNASVTLVEYGDYECPACAAYAPLVAQAAEKFPEDLRIVYRHSPIPGHVSSVPAAYAAEAAAIQGKFWEMSDLLFTAQRDWMNQDDPQGKFEGYAQSLELDVEKFKQDYVSQSVMDKVVRDAKTAQDSGVNATPTFFINGVQLEKLPGSPQAFFDLIQKEIDSQKAE